MQGEGLQGRAAGCNFRLAVPWRIGHWIRFVCKHKFVLAKLLEPFLSGFFEMNYSPDWGWFADLLWITLLGIIKSILFRGGEEGVPFIFLQFNNALIGIG